MLDESDKPTRRDKPELSSSNRKRLKRISKDSRTEWLEPSTAHEELLQLTFSLDRDHYPLLAAAFSRFLLGEATTLDQAIGLKRQGRGSPTKPETLKRDIRILEERLIEGKSWARIQEMDLSVGDRDTRKLLGCYNNLLDGKPLDPKFASRFTRAFAGVIANRLDEPDSPSGE